MAIKNIFHFLSILSTLDLNIPQKLHSDYHGTEKILIPFNLDLGTNSTGNNFILLYLNIQVNSLGIHSSPYRIPEWKCTLTVCRFAYFLFTGENKISLSFMSYRKNYCNCLFIIGNFIFKNNISSSSDPICEIRVWGLLGRGHFSGQLFDHWYDINYDKYEMIQLYNNTR